MFKIICVTNRDLCKRDFHVQMEKIAEGRPDALILREKDLAEDEYEELALNVMGICDRAGVMFIPHLFTRSAAALGSSIIHLPLSVLSDTPVGDLAGFDTIGASCHSADDALLAAKLYASYITVGHIFETDCKKGLSPRGLKLLKSAANAVDIPVYAIGGINEDNIASVKEAGASGACIMSGFMTSDDPAAMIKRLREKVE